ncbi:hypothetical protein HPB50_026545 [Hyalomma asiaticum]|uniref:Uncharacterized protein n=1 Tax=Hyalomma asiaticum TaxID=266040 RepID=A0ACB7TNQ7_HYAAI|nr:hypothetical protein HPB50_026545 [Hyalomma asiaticum]
MALFDDMFSDFQDQGNDCQPRTLYVGNLDTAVTEELLVAVFGQMGQVKGCKIIHEPGNDPYCFVEFSDHQSAASALLAMNKRLCFGKILSARVGHSPKYSDYPKAVLLSSPFIATPPTPPPVSTPARIPKFLFLGRNELRQGAWNGSEPFYAYLLVCRTCASCSLLVCVRVRMADGKPSAQTDGTKRKALDISTKRVILDELAQGAKNCELVKKYGVSKSTISTILKNKDKIISANANSTDRKRLRRATYADVEEVLLKWFVDARARNIPISGPMMLAKAKDFAFLLDFPDFCPGNGWLHRFKAYYRRRVVERMLIAVDRPAANLPLRVSLYSALEMVKASWAEVTATCVQNFPQGRLRRRGT